MSQTAIPGPDGVKSTTGEPAAARPGTGPGRSPSLVSRAISDKTLWWGVISCAFLLIGGLGATIQAGGQLEP
jgi:hypothetical protein